ncbi:hypothetical protein P691DRAFT_736113 [Macrolepiota fuliginosa MF-IS2]|uniref:Uncharacterized protein n=1 Tax=Macrolepiota fuliginosa MF-IS2 TaxID=1400762 RepID=A0A9P6C0S2_9AGAR|nr:hypothetical protein P691DRAFT_736113 [Macrolepiota fuliginosa MF-IS2]
MPSDRTLVILFDVLVLMAVVLLLCTLLPAVFSKNVYRSIGWYNLMTAWLVYSLSYGLLVGRQVESADPPLDLCLFQTSLIYAVPGLASASMVCYNVEFYLIISGLRSGTPRPPSFSRTFWLVVIPWLVFLMIILEVLLLVFPGRQLHLLHVAANNLYCHLNNSAPAQVTSAIIICAVVILIPLEVCTGSLMYRNWDVFGNLSRTTRRLFLTVYLRLIISTLAAVTAFAFSMLTFVFKTPDAKSLVYPIVPIAIAFAFGTQKDLLRAWLFWRAPRPDNPIVFNSGTLMTTGISASGSIGTNAVRTQRLESISGGDSLGKPTPVPETLALVSSTRVSVGMDVAAPAPTAIYL